MILFGLLMTLPVPAGCGDGGNGDEDAAADTPADPDAASDADTAGDPGPDGDVPAEGDVPADVAPEDTAGDDGGGPVAWPQYEDNPFVITLNIPPHEDDSAGSIIAADVDDDGLLDFVVTRRGYVTAAGHFGEELWTLEIDIQVDNSSEDVGLPGHHGPGVQAGDIDDDGATEVVFLTRDGTLHVRAGADGSEEWSAVPPAPTEGTDRWEHPVIANLRGEGDRDVVLQSTSGSYRLGRHVAAYAFADLEAGGAEALWATNDFVPLAHNGLRIADLDGDGRDEILGGAILSSGGVELTRLPIGIVSSPHLDSVFVADVLPDEPGQEVVALQEGGDQYVFLYDDQQTHWQTNYNVWEPQNAAIGEFVPDSPGLEIWCRSRFDEDQQPFVFDSGGELITSYVMNDVKPETWSVRGVEVIYAIHWTGEVRQLAAAKERHVDNDVAIFDPITGEFLVVIDETAARLYVVDVSGDWREELVVVNGSEIHVYHNEDENPRPDEPRLWEDNGYRRSRMTWNYYSP